MLNPPCNPTGAVCSQGELLALAGVLRRHAHARAHVLSDDIYEKLTYDAAFRHHGRGRSGLVRPHTESTACPRETQ